MNNLRIACGLLLLLLPSLASGEKEVPDSARHLSTERRTRKLLFLPLKNHTGEKDLDYLSYGIPTLIFSNIRTNFLIEGNALTVRDIRPAGGRDEEVRSIVPILLTASLLDFRSAALRERQRGLPAELSLIPVREAELQEKQPADLAIQYGAEWYAFGTLDFEPVPEPVYIDPQGRKIRITQEIRKQFEGRELPSQWKRLLAEKKPERLIVTMHLRSFEREGDLWSHRFILPVNNPYESTDFAAPAHRFEETIRERNPHLLRLRSQRTGFVFLNGVFAGKTPLDIRVPGSAIQVTIEQDGCNLYRREWKPGIGNDIRAACETVRGRAGLTVESAPVGADVFLNHEYLGKTPLRRSDLPPGVHRIRVSAKGYIDGFYGVELKDGTLVKVSAALNSGDTVAFYTDPGYVIQDWTYDDLSLGLFLQSVIFGMGWGYSNIRAGAIRDSIRSPLLPYFYPDPSYGIVQYQIFEDTRIRALQWERTGKVMGGLGMLSLAGAAYYVFRGLDHDDRPFGELEARSRPVLFGSHSYAETVYGVGMHWSF